jgi:hypothetical protein
MPMKKARQKHARKNIEKFKKLLFDLRIFMKHKINM